jgi:hypothetical protein
VGFAIAAPEEKSAQYVHRQRVFKKAMYQEFLPTLQRGFFSIKECDLFE